MSRSSLMRLVQWAVGIAVIAGGVLAFVSYRKRHTEVEPRYKTTPVEKATITAKVTATGTLSARVTVQVGSQVSGRLQEINVDYNSPVTKGQVIAKLDKRLFQAALESAVANQAQAQGAVAKSKANLLQSERALERAENLAKEGLLNTSDLEVARAAREAAAADVVVSQGTLQQAAAQRSQAEVNIGFTTIVSPIDGIVLSRAVDVGQTVAASLQAPVLFTIAQDLKVIQVDTFVAEADVGKLRQGMDAIFTVDAYPGQRFKGKVRDIRNAAQVVQNVVTYDAVLDVENAELKLKPGMTANVTFVYAESRDVPSLPNAALRFKLPADAIASAASSAPPGAPAATPSDSAAVASATPPSGGAAPPPQGGRRGGPRRLAPEASDHKTVYVLRGETPVAVNIVTGVTDGTKTEILPGDLKLGDPVIVDLSATAPSTTSTGARGGAPGGRLF